MLLKQALFACVRLIFLVNSRTRQGERASVLCRASNKAQCTLFGHLWSAIILVVVFVATKAHFPR